MGVLNDNTIIGASAAGGYEIDNSLRFNDDDSAYLSRTPASAGNRKTWTWSGWVKRGNLGDGSIFTADSATSEQTSIAFRSDDGIQIAYWNDPTGGFFFDMRTTALYRDASAWYHIMVAMDTTQATSSDRIKLYINGSQVTSFSTASYPALNLDTQVNNTVAQGVGAFTGPSGANYFDGYLSEVNFIDGLALTPDSFGETGDYGEWKPLRYTGAYGTNGFHLDFKNSGSLGNDAAGSNNWTPTNLAATDQMLDSPTNNFATMNPLDIGDFNTTYGATAFYEGNLKFKVPFVGQVYSTIGASSGKWYVEFLNQTDLLGIGVGTEQVNTYYSAAFQASIAAGAVSAVGDIIALKLDFDLNTAQYSVNNGSYTNLAGSIVSGGDKKVGAGRWSNVGSTDMVNFGQDSSFAGNKTAQGNSDANGIGDFYYAPPAGFLALCTQNLPDATVIPSEHFNTVLYTGNGSTQSITGVGFQSDFTWTKSRSSADSHTLQNSVAGVAQNMSSNGTQAEGADARLSSFDADGFTLTNNTGANGSGKSFVSWNWKANGTGVSNTDGTITSTVSANVDAGFSIVSYTGTNTDGVTVGHGLSRYPEIVIFKNREATSNWLTMTSMISKVGYINSTAALTTSRSYFSQSENSTWTSSIGLDAHVACNSADDFIAYAFHSVDGYSKVGSYTGNGSTDGTFVHCGFRPAYVVIKRTDGVSNWAIYDAARDTYNAADTFLYADGTTGDQTYGAIDFASNGFKHRSLVTALNASGGTYIYLAFAESPFKHSNAR